MTSAQVERRRICMLFVCAGVVGLSAALARAQDSAPAATRESAPSALSPDEIGRAIRELESIDEDVGHAAYERLLSARSQAGSFVPQVLGMLDSPNFRAGTRAIWLLIELGPAATSAEGPLLTRLAKRAHDETEALMALRALGAIGTSPEKMADAYRKTLTRHGAHSDPPYVTVDLRQYDPAGRWAIPILAVALESDDLLLRHRAAQELGSYGSTARAVAPALLAALAREFPKGQKSGDPEASSIEGWFSDSAPAHRGVDCSPGEVAFIQFRNPYLWAIGQFGPADEATLKAVLDIAASGSIALQPDAIRVAAMIDPSGAQAAKLCASRIASPNAFVRLGAVDGIRLTAARGITVRHDLSKLFPGARPYELLPLCRTIEALGWDSKPDAAKLAGAIRGTPDAAAAAAAHRIGLTTPVDAAGIQALLAGLDSAEPWMTCLCALSLGRIGSPDPAVPAALLASLDRIKLDGNPSIWDERNAAFLIDALGRLGRGSGAEVAKVAAVARALDASGGLCAPVSGLSLKGVARAYCMMKPPPEVAVTVRTGMKTRSDPSWFADWGQHPPGAGLLSRVERAADGTIWIEFGERPRGWADWSTIVCGPFDGAALVALGRKDASTLHGRVVGWMEAIAWCLGQEPPVRSAAPRKGELRIDAADISAPQRLGLEFAVQEGEARRPGLPPPYRWRGGFSIANPWRASAK